MQQYGSNARGGGGTRRASRMERLLNKSGIFKPLKDEGAGFNSAPRWRKRYKLTGTEYYLYLMFDETYLLAKGRQAELVSLEDFKADNSREVSDFMTDLEDMRKEIHGLAEE